MQAFRVLVVEHKSDDILMLKRAFGSMPQKVIIDLARDRRDAIVCLEGLCAFQDPLPAVVVLDAGVTETNALELLSWMRQHPQFRSTPVVVLGDSSNPQEVDRAYRIGASSFLSKRCDAQEILNEVQRLCPDCYQGLFFAAAKSSAPPAADRISP